MPLWPGIGLKRIIHGGKERSMVILTNVNNAFVVYYRIQEVYIGGYELSIVILTHVDVFVACNRIKQVTTRTVVILTCHHCLSNLVQNSTVLHTYRGYLDMSLWPQQPGKEFINFTIRGYLDMSPLLQQHGKEYNSFTNLKWLS